MVLNSVNFIKLLLISALKPSKATLIALGPTTLLRGLLVLLRDLPMILGLERKLGLFRDVSLVRDFRLAPNPRPEHGGLVRGAQASTNERSPDEPLRRTAY